MVAQERAGHKNFKPKNPHAFKDGQAVTVKGFVWRRLVTLFLVAGMAGGAAAAQDSGKRGQVTNLPMPRYVSMKANEGNVRRGPSLTHRIDWVFKRRDMPLQITAEHGHWRRVQDRDGAGGWVHYALLSGARTVLIEKDMLQVHAHPDPQSPITAAFELGVVARLGACVPDWCRISAGGHRGWAEKKFMWGVRPDELRD